MYKLNEEENKELKIEMLASDYKICHTDFFETNEYKSLVADIITSFPSYYDNDIDLKNCTKSELLEAGKTVIDRHTQGTDIRVRYVDMDSLTADLFSIFGEKPKEDKYDEILNYIDDNIEIIEVTKVPIEINFNKLRNGHTGITWFYGTKKVNEEYYKKLKPVIKKISIEGACDDDSKCTYVHEMYHALIDSHKGSIENLLYNEVLPVYMEKVASLDLDRTSKLEELKELIRLLNIKNNILTREKLNFNEEKKLNRIEMETYIVSSAIASSLFETYKNGNKDIKNEIDNSINGIFREEHTLEDVLQRFDATPEKGSNIMRSNIKKLSK